MALALEQRLRRAIAIAAARGSVGASARVREALSRELGDDVPALVSLEAAATVLVMPTRVDATGACAGDPVQVAVPLIAVLDDDGVLASALAGADGRGVVSVLCRRGRIEIEGGSFLVLEVEDGVSARETHLEYGVPMLADERLVAFE